MTSQILNTELGNIIQESKRKNNEIKNAADKSLQDLRALPSTSEMQLAADLRRRPYFVSPFIHACRSGSAKLALSGATCLQRLIVSNGLAKERLAEVLEAFQESSKIGLECQLKILQSLPSLLQGYSDSFQGQLLYSLIQICNALQHVKTAVVSSTAAATFQQIITFVFERVEMEDAKSNRIPASTELRLEGESVYLRPAADDAYKIFDDICLLSENHKARTIRGATLTQNFGLELIETILSNYGNILSRHAEQAHLLKTRVVPLITQQLVDRVPFSILVRSLRIFCIALRNHIEIVQSGFENALIALLHSLDAEPSVLWRRALAMECFKVIFSSPTLTTRLYTLFDAVNGRKKIIQEILSAFVRLAAEKPTLIGLGSQSSFPSGPGLPKSTSQEQAVIEAGGVAGIIPGEIGVVEANAPGIGTQWSTMKTPCLDQLDKNEPLPVAETYSLGLLLTCINNLAEGLAKVILPLATTLTVETTDDARDATVYQGSEDQDPPESGIETQDQKNADHTHRPPRQGSLKSTSSESGIATARVVSALINDCWPAILAASSTFMNAALDADFYRNLIRSLQRITQVAGILKLSTPRDAFLTSLAKAAIPSNALRGVPVVQSTSAQGSPMIGSLTAGFASSEVLPGQNQSDSSNRSRRTSVDIALPPLNQRNLMCLRALLNLAIALGSLLEQAWSIIFESLQKADLILAQSGSTNSTREFKAGADNNDPGNTQTVLGTEVAAVESAASRLFQSTSEYSDEAFKHVLQSLCDLLNVLRPETVDNVRRPSSSQKRRTPSVTSVVSVATTYSRGGHFAIAKIGEIARVNISRFMAVGDSEDWQLLIETLQYMITSRHQDNTARLMAADVIASISVGITVEAIAEPHEVRSEVQQRALSTLNTIIESLYAPGKSGAIATSSLDFDLHRAMLDALHTILEQCGESLVAGWRLTFSIISSTFATKTQDGTEQINDTSDSQERLDVQVSPKLVRSAFASIELICSDFLDTMKTTRITILIDILSRFRAQMVDLNISLTTITLLWNLSDFLRSCVDIQELESACSNLSDEASRSQRILTDRAEAGSVPHLWLLLQHRLALMTEDSRPNVRNGLLQAIFRIMSSFIHESVTSLWSYCYRAVALEALLVNIKQQSDLRRLRSNEDATPLSNLNASTDIALKSLTGILASQLEDETVLLNTVPNFRKGFFDAMDQYLAFGDPEIASSVFNSLSTILTANNQQQSLSAETITDLANLWFRNTPAQPIDGPKVASKDDHALLAYVGMMKTLYPSLRSSITKIQIEAHVTNLLKCVEMAPATPYSSDVDSMTKLQAATCECFEALDTEVSSSASTIIYVLARFVSLPFDESKDRQRLSYVAFAKRSMDLLRSIIEKQTENRTIWSGDCITESLDALKLSIERKYSFKKQGKSPTLWRKATTTAVSLAQTLLQISRNLSLPTNKKTQLWQCCIRLMYLVGIMETSTLPLLATLVDDETFDISALSLLRDTIVPNSLKEPAIGILDPKLPGSIRFEYARNLFHISLIHERDIVVPTAPLSDLYRIRNGRTRDSSFANRIRSCYWAFDELFSIVAETPLKTYSHIFELKPTSQHGSNSDGLKSLREEKSLSRQKSQSAPRPETGRYHPQINPILAQAAFPLLILRCSLPLKRYIADQPLRGPIPTPTSQRLELIYLLEKIVELKTSVSVDDYVLTEENTSTSNNEFDVQQPQNGMPKAFVEQGERVNAPKKPRPLNPVRRHLEWLMPLVERAAREARGDKRLADLMSKVAEVALEP